MRPAAAAVAPPSPRTPLPSLAILPSLTDDPVPVLPHRVQVQAGQGKAGRVDERLLHAHARRGQARPRLGHPGLDAVPFAGQALDFLLQGGDAGGRHCAWAGR